MRCHPPSRRSLFNGGLDSADTGRRRAPPVTFFFLDGALGRHSFFPAVNTSKIPLSAFVLPRRGHSFFFAGDGQVIFSEVFFFFPFEAFRRCCLLRWGTFPELFFPYGRRPSFSTSAALRVLFPWSLLTAAAQVGVQLADLLFPAALALPCDEICFLEFFFFSS